VRGPSVSRGHLVTTIADQPAVRATLIVTAPGVVATREMRVLLEGFDLAFVSTLMASADPEGIETAWQHADYTLAQVRTTEPDVVIQNTVAFCLNGDSKAADKLAQRITDTSGAQAVVGLTAVIQALHAVEGRSPIILTPYVDAVRRRFSQVLTTHGIEVSGWGGPTISDPASINRAPTDVVDYAEDALADHPDADSVLVCGGAWSSLGVCAAMEEKTGLPVLTSNIAQAWYARQLCGLTNKPPHARHWGNLGDSSTGPF
jgi:maleate cis-trans isomerase